LSTVSGLTAKLSNHLASGWQLLIRPQRTEPERLFDLMDELQVRRAPRAAVQAEPDQ